MLWTLIWLIIGGAVLAGLVAIIKAFAISGNDGAKKKLKMYRAMYAVQDKALSEIAGNMAGSPVATAQVALDDTRRIRYSTDS